MILILDGMATSALRDAAPHQAVKDTTMPVVRVPVAAQCDKFLVNFIGFVKLAAVTIWLK